MYPNPHLGAHRRTQGHHLGKALAAGLAASLVVAMTPQPAQAQIPEVPGPDGVPSVSDLIEQIGDIEGLAPLDPVLNPVADLIIQIENALGLGGEPTGVNSFALAGDDAIEAAISFSQLAFEDGSGTAILGRDDLFADAMSSSGFQGVADAPLLLTGTDDLDRRTGMELQRLGIDAITVLGGEDAINPLVVNKLEIAGLTVTRVGGPTRVETAVEAAEATSPAATHAVLVRAYPDAGEDDNQAYADLLAAGPYAAENGWPVLMTPSSTLHPAVLAELARFDEVTIIGGTGAISDTVAQALTTAGLTVDRVSGANRFATAVAIANARGFESSADPDQMVIVEQGGRDDVWAPGFAATAYADQASAPVLLSDGETLPEETIEFINAGVEENLEDGGPAIICAPFVSESACEGAGALATGNASEGADILGLPLEDLPLIGEVLDALLGAGLLPEELQDVLEGLIGDDDEEDPEDPEDPDGEDEGPTGTPIDDLIPGLPEVGASTATVPSMPVTSIPEGL